MMATPPRSDRPMAPGYGSTMSPRLTLENMCAAWLAAQGLSRKPPSPSLFHPVQGPPTVSEANAAGQGRRRDPGTHTALPSPALCPPGLRSPVISIDPPSSTVQHGQDASFTCLIHDGAAPISLEWKTRNQELQGEPDWVPGVAEVGYECTVATTGGWAEVTLAPNSLCDPG